MTSGPAGFWSYTHDDDKHENDRITLLAEDVKSEFVMLRGEELQLFVDRSSLDWGAAWQQRIDAALQEATFFFAVLTPRYFRSEHCRAELIKFAGFAKSLGMQELLMPLLYVDVDGFSVDSPDEAMALAASAQYLDWRESRFLERNSVRYKLAVNLAAKRIAQAAERLSTMPTVVVTDNNLASRIIAEATHADDLDDEGPGWLELMQLFETEMPRVSGYLSGYSAQMELAAEIMNTNTAKITEADAAGKPFSYRVTLAREMAAELDGPATEMLNLARSYFGGLETVDPAVRALIRTADEQQPEGDDLTGVCEFLAALRGAISSAREMTGLAKRNVSLLEGMSGLSRDLRPVANRMRDASQIIADGQAILDGWEETAEATSIICPEGD